jgi:tRNA (cmo5U34)-methyltransferase
MPEPDSKPIFTQDHAAAYDTRFAKLAPLRDALHLLISALFADLPAQARILCVGAGTGAELIFLARKFPGWEFTAVEPSGPMLDACRRKAEAEGITSRCTFHEGYLDSLPASEPFDAATSLLVSQFILDMESRSAFFREIARRLQPEGILASADLASDTSSAVYQSVLDVWLKLMKETDMAPEQIEGLREVYGRDVALLPLEETSTIIASGGFAQPVLFLQTGLIHAWYARKPAV